MSNQIHQDQILQWNSPAQSHFPLTLYTKPVHPHELHLQMLLPQIPAIKQHQLSYSQHPFSFPRVCCCLCVSTIAQCPLRCQEKQDKNHWDKTIPVSQILLHEDLVLNPQFVSSGVSHLLARLSGERTLLPPKFLQHISCGIVTRSQNILDLHRFPIIRH